jgi:hypothetical protein
VRATFTVACKLRYQFSNISYFHPRTRHDSMRNATAARSVVSNDASGCRLAMGVLVSPAVDPDPALDPHHFPIACGKAIIKAFALLTSSVL